MAAKLTDAEREQIIDLIRSGMPRNEIARAVGRSNSTVSKIAREIGHNFLDHVDASSKTRLTRAHEARSSFCAEARASAAAVAQDRLREILDEFTDDRVMIIPTTYGVERIMAPPDARSIRDLASAAHTLQRLVIDIDRHDNKADDGLAAVDQWLRGLVGDEAAA